MVQASDGQTYRVCPRCGGSGAMVMRAASVWAAEDRDADPEGFEEMLAGTYDVTCDRCKGRRVVTAASDRAFKQDESDRFTRLRECGIYPGSPDYF